jgi:hypothetical protein
MTIPPLLLRDLLVVEREAGAEFEDAWQRSVQPALAETPVIEHEQWLVALSLSRPFWERIFERQSAQGL